MNIECLDNFLSIKSFNFLSEILLSSRFTWYYNDYRVMPGDDSFQFTHTLYRDKKNISPFFQQIPIELKEKLDVHTLLKFKINLNTKQNKIKISKYHIDVSEKNSTTAIFYINTNNGGTYFENGPFYKSVANRLIRFPSNLYHAGSTHTDTKRRLVLNINYISNTQMENK